jgi:hypothetical protein
MSETEWRAQIAELQELLETSQAHVKELRDGVAHIVWVLKEKQPNPRTISPTYMAGYARAMDDMKQAVMSVVSGEVVTQSQLTRIDFDPRVREQLELGVGVQAVAKEGEESDY